MTAQGDREGPRSGVQDSDWRETDGRDEGGRVARIEKLVSARAHPVTSMEVVSPVK